MCKKLLFLLVFFLFENNKVLQAQNELNIMTFNIRLNIAEKDSMNNWPERKEKVSGQVLFMETDLLGVQEAKPEQMIDLQNDLPDYKYVGVAREAGAWGEFSAIFYNTKRLEILKQNTFWLSEHTENPGVKGWDAACPRIITYGYFKDKISKKTFYVFNTHFDHVGQIARRESAKLLLQKVEEIGGKEPIIVMGDFNSKPSDEPIKIITDPKNSAHLSDSKSISEKKHFGPTGTFNGFESKEKSNDPIDYIFVKNNVKVLKHATLSPSWNGYFSSDHFPVFARIRM